MDTISRCSNLRRRLHVVIIMSCVSVLLTMYAVALACCHLVGAPAVGVAAQDSALTEGDHPHLHHPPGLDAPNDPQPRPHRVPGVAILHNQDEDESRYQRILDDVGDHTPEYSPSRRKGLRDQPTRLRHRDPDSTRDARLVHNSHGLPGDFAPEHDLGAKPHNHRYHVNSYSDIELSLGSEDYDTGSSEKHNSDAVADGVRTSGISGSNHERTSKGAAHNRTQQQSASRKLPQAVIIGVKKGGTRALLEFLRIHPDVRAPGPEPHFFDKNYEKGLDWYRLQMPSTLEGQMTIEKTPSYFVTKGVPSRVSAMSRHVKLIVVVRDPVTRAVSDYTQALSKRSDVKSFQEMAFEDNSTGLVDTSWGAVRIGVYAKHLERWLQYFPLSQMHFVSGERLITDPAGEMAKVQNFLGLKPVITDKHFYFNATKGFPCLKKPEGSGNPHCLGKTKGRPHPKVDPKVLQRLRDFFRPFNQKFYQMVGEDFGWL